MKLVLKGLSFLILALVITGCSQSMEEAFDKGESHVKDTFLSTEGPEANYTVNDFELYKPDELRVSEQNASNIVFNDSGQSYILFINEFEAPNSRWFYNQIENKDQYLRTFQTDEAFAYLHADNYEEDSYEVHVGIGGIKMSTVTTPNQMEDDITMMINMIKSVEQK
ncbi:hypothetical protein ABID56_000764 [Alkalibacillus flavidus]|uniref:Lipoprotein n=1 Tax=Alkalibacillus flavidus TaxID=546021 RepID=A0ABV2KSX7_9BACI